MDQSLRLVTELLKFCYDEPPRLIIRKALSSPVQHGLVVSAATTSKEAWLGLVRASEMEGVMRS